MAVDIFSLTGKIAVDYSEAISGMDKVKSSAKNVADSLESVDESAGNAGESVDDAGESAESASDGFTTWKGVLSNLVTNTITSLISKVAELASSIVDLTKTAVSDYADYEQLVGGVETLFDESSDALLAYAENAYETAGLSANDYMETATSFAASLLQGLEGDTEQAVELTNLAITDMSDNANKMGTDMEAIQNAYQGFAKQNYTMLDNLKLGYGGTESEMIRLINDSGILEEEISDLDNVTFDQMIEAIHEIQTEMGITGTTAEEAGSTISGSWNSVQALFENILTKVGSELAPVVMDFLSELSAWMESIDWDAFAEQVGSAFGELFEWVQSIDFTSFFESGLDGIMSFIDGLGQLLSNLPEIISTIQSFINIISEIAPLIVGVVTAIGTFNGISSIFGVLTQLGESFTGLGTIMSTITSGPIALIVAAIVGLVSAIIYLWNNNEDFRNAVISIWETIKNAFSTAIEAVKTVVNGFVTALSTAWEAIKTAVSTVFEAIKTIFTTIWDAIVNVVTWRINATQTVITTVINAIKTVITTVLNAIKNTFTNIWNGIKTTVTNVINGVKSVISTGLNGAFSTVTNILTNIKNKFSSIFETVKTTVSNAIEKIKSYFNFSWSLPSLKLPHITASGSFSLNPLSVPHFSISWYKKAMEDGMIMNSPTIFGFDSESNSLLAGGEAGSETVVGTDSLMEMIAAAVNAENEALIDQFETLISLLSEFIPEILSGMNRSVVLDTGTLVGELAPGMDKELGSIAKRKGR